MNEKPPPGRVALITGGSSGIGLGIARELIRLGAKVIITGRDSSKLKKAAAEIGVSAVTADVTKVLEIEKIYLPLMRRGGPIVIQAVAFLASDPAGYINGIELFVDGGASQI